MGRTPQPTALKIERGNPGQRPLNQNEPELAKPAAKMPAGLKGRARREWTRLAPELIEKGVLTVGDMHAFEEYCRLVGEIDTYEAEIAALVEKGNREEAHRLGYVNHVVKIRRLLAQLRQQLGLTPTARASVQAVKATPKDDAAKKRQRFFGTGKPA